MSWIEIVSVLVGSGGLGALAGYATQRARLRTAQTIAQERGAAAVVPGLLTRIEQLDVALDSARRELACMAAQWQADREVMSAEIERVSCALVALRAVLERLVATAADVPCEPTDRRACPLVVEAARAGRELAPAADKA